MREDFSQKTHPFSQTAEVGIPPARPLRRKSFLARVFMHGLCLFFFALFLSLGFWQIHRLAWKTKLIATVQERVHKAPVPAPPPRLWNSVTVDTSAYLPVYAEGHFLNDKEILVTAMAQETTGYYVMTPLECTDHSIIFINRGFVPQDKKDKKTRLTGLIEGPTHVQGLLRLSEGPGHWFRKNDPQNNKWFNRNVAQMAKSLNLSSVAPYFIDADNTPNKGGLPIGGLTKVHFYNAHLSYILTWFTLAVGVLLAWLFFVLEGYKRRKPDSSS